MTFKETRARMGLTQARMAEALSEALGRKIGREGYRTWENGTVKPPADVLAFMQSIEGDDEPVTAPVFDTGPAAVPADQAPSAPPGPETTAPPVLFSSASYTRICTEMWELIATGVGMVGAAIGSATVQTDGMIIYEDRAELGAAWGKLAETNETFRRMLVASEKQGAYLAVALATGTTFGKIYRNHAVVAVVDSASVLHSVTTEEPPADDHAA